MSLGFNFGFCLSLVQFGFDKTLTKLTPTNFWYGLGLVRFKINLV